MATRTRRHGSRLAGGLLLWFGTLGGVVAWTVHLIAAWGIDELSCAAGERDVAGVPLRLVLMLSVVVPGAVALAALVVAFLSWRRIASAGEDGGRRMQRARLLAVVGVYADLLSVAMIAFGGAALVVLQPCQS